MIRDGIVAARPDAVVEIVDAMAEAGGIIQRVVGQEAPLQKRWLNWWFDLEYRFLIGWRPMRTFITWFGSKLARRPALRFVTRTRPDVIVSTYPGATEVLGRLRGSGEVRVPVVSAITDLSALWMWAQRDVDLHLITHAESTEEVRAIAPRSRVVWARGMTSPAFDAPVAED